MKSKLCSFFLFSILVVYSSHAAGKSENNSQVNPSYSHKPSSFESARQRQYYISNRDSYVNAANSFGSQAPSTQHGAVAVASSHHGNMQGFMSSSYQVPQNSYGAPSQNYGVQYGDYDDHDGQSSKGGGADLAGLIGLIGLKGLKGTIPLIKIATFALLSLIPTLVPLALFKLFLVLLKPVVLPGRDLSGNPLTDMYFGTDSFSSNTAERVSLNKLKVYNDTNTNATSWGEDVYNEIVDKGLIIGNDLLGKDADSQCMQRIACEGVFKSLPRIFLRILGEGSQPVIRKRRDASKPEIQAQDTYTTARRKDLATVALNRLRNSQYLTKKPSLIDYKDTDEICKQYKCSNLF